LSCASGCSGIQSALDPAGDEAASIASLFWVMTTVGGAIWLGVVGLLVYALMERRSTIADGSAGQLILWGGAIFPAFVLIVLLAYALWLMPSLRPFSREAAVSLTIEVTAKQYWWRVVYHRAGNPPIVAANEIRLPVGERVEFTLRSEDVIHSFWIPALGGKMDMIPGRVNRLSLTATKPGTFRGPCAEYCGTSHALMAFTAIPMTSGDFQSWIAAEAAPSPGLDGPGATLFVRHGCGACHSVAGTDARGMIAPDLSHIGSRETLGAGILSNSAENLALFIAEPDRFKPGVQMPAFGMLPNDDIRMIAAWLKGLK
jgi:cytochrome c oxidase subunit II